MKIDFDYVEMLYKTYQKEINTIRERQRSKYGSHFHPQYDDIEAELLCLFILHLKPKNILEVSPCNGWSSSYMLEAMSFYEGATLHSFDIADKVVDQVRRHPNFKLTIADFTKLNVKQEDYDFFFFDSDHSTAFGEFYMKNIVLKIDREIPIFVHDCFHNPTIGTDEPAYVYEYVKDIIFTAANKRPEHGQVQEIRKKYITNLSKIHYYDGNTGMIFFTPIKDIYAKD